MRYTLFRTLTVYRLDFPDTEEFAQSHLDPRQILADRLGVKADTIEFDDEDEKKNGTRRVFLVHSPSKPVFEGEITNYEG